MSNKLLIFLFYCCSILLYSCYPKIETVPSEEDIAFSIWHEDVDPDEYKSLVMKSNIPYSGQNKTYLLNDYKLDSILHNRIKSTLMDKNWTINPENSSADLLCSISIFNSQEFGSPPSTLLWHRYEWDCWGFPDTVIPEGPYYPKRLYNNEAYTTEKYSIAIELISVEPYTDTILSKGTVVWFGIITGIDEYADYESMQRLEIKIEEVFNNENFEKPRLQTQPE